MSQQGSPPPLLEAPEIPGDQARERGLVWADAEAETGDTAPEEAGNRLLVPEQWVEDAVRGALAQHQDDIVEAALDELRKRKEDLR